ncbi:hypothetical protein [Streptomyces qinglanensis]
MTGRDGLQPQIWDPNFKQPVADTRSEVLFTFCVAQQHSKGPGPVGSWQMGTCKKCGATGLDDGMTLCDSCLREIGSAMQELERQGVDLHDPDDPANPFAPPPS